MIPVLTFELVRELPQELRGRGFVPGRVSRGPMRRVDDGGRAFTRRVLDAMFEQMWRGGVR